MAGTDQDYWISVPNQSSIEATTGSDRAVIFKDLGQPNGANDRSSGSAWLRRILHEPNSPSQCYLLVDGTLRAEVAGHFDLDVLPIEAVSLFDDSAAQITGEVAPWLVRLTLPKNDDEPDTPFCRDFFKRHWPAGFSILILTNASLEAVRAHLRRFTRLPLTEDDRVLTFRFWDPRVLHPFLKQLTDDRARARRITMTNDGAALSYLLPGGKDGFPVLVSPGPGLAAEPIRPMRLSYSDFDPIARANMQARRDRMVARLQADFATELADTPPARLKHTVEAALRHYAAYGIKSHAHLHMMAAWSVFYGVGFERGDPSGELEAILRSDKAEKERFKAFRARFDRFEMSPERFT